ncbi:MAG: tyrosine-type recombinase/integrase [Polyangiaceae bacterium]|nr:tyrosine-type recombinase/integrase [Polyangiaceae bacterium]
MLPRRLLEVLREYFREARLVGPELFPGGKPGTVLSRNAVNKALRLAAARAAIRKRVTPHALRRAFATHLLEAGTDLRALQVLLGQVSIRSTVCYAQVSPVMIRRAQSPADRLQPARATAGEREVGPMVRRATGAPVATQPVPSPKTPPPRRAA